MDLHQGAYPFKNIMQPLAVIFVAGKLQYTHFDKRNITFVNRNEAIAHYERTRIDTENYRQPIAWEYPFLSIEQVNKTTKKILLNYILAPVLLLLLLWLIYRQVNGRGSFANELQQLRRHLENSNAALVIFVILLAPVNWCTEAFKWQMLLRKIEPVPYIKALSSVLTGMAFGLVTPSKIGDFAGRILYLEDKNKLRAAIATLIGNTAQTLVTFIAGTCGLVYLNIRYPGSWQVFCLIAAIISGVCLAYFYIRIDTIANWAEGKTWLRKVIISIRILKRYSKRELLQVLLVSLVRFCTYNTQFLIVANIMGAGIPWTGGFLLAAVMFWMITVIPSFFVADLGVRGYVAGLLFTETGIAGNGIAILAGSYVVWLLNWALPAIIGSLLLLTVRIVK